MGPPMPPGGGQQQMPSPTSPPYPSRRGLFSQDIRSISQQNIHQQQSSGPSSPRLRSSSSSRIDEGYSEDTPMSEDPFNTISARRRFQFSGDRVILPDWMMALDDSMREEIAYKLVRTLPTSNIANFVERLVPVLHRDFVTILPVELTLQIFSYLDYRTLLLISTVSHLWRRHALDPTLWRELYKREGWEYYEKEVRAFEDEIQKKQELERRAYLEAKRKVEEASINRAKYTGWYRGEHATGSSHSLFNDNGPIELDESLSDAEVEPQGSHHPRLMNNLSFSSLQSSDEEELYPAPSQAVLYPEIYDTRIPIVSQLTIPGYGPTKLNWLFLFKQRRRLEENWLYNRFTPFKIPHPAYPQEGHGDCIYTIQYSPNFLVSGSRDKSIRRWDMKTRRLIGAPLMGHLGSVLCLQFDESPEEDVIISGSSDSSVIVWRFSTGKPLKTIQNAHQESILNLRFNRKYLVTCSKDKLIKVWNRYEFHPNMPEYPFTSKKLFGNNRQQPGQAPVAAIHRIQDPAYAILEPYTNIQLLQGHVAAVNAIQLHGDEIASASGDRLIKIWNINTGTCEKTMLGHSKGIACIQYDGRTVVSGSSDWSIRIFDRFSGTDIYKLDGHKDLVRTVQASKDRIVSGSYDETVRIWVRRRVLKGPIYEGDDPDSFVEGAIIKGGSLPGTTATGYGLGIGAVHGNSMMQIQQAIANHAAAQAQQQRMQMHNGPPHTLYNYLFPQHHAPQGHHHLPLQHPMHAPPHAPHVPPNHQPQQHIPGPAGPTHVQPPHAHQQHPPQQQPQQQGDTSAPQPQPQPQLHPANAPPTHQLQPHHQPQHHNPYAFPPGAPNILTHPYPHHIPAPQQENHPRNRNLLCKVFKLQFDARWIICCCQDGKMMGWDFANDEPDLIDAARFFKGG